MGKKIFTILRSKIVVKRLKFLFPWRHIKRLKLQQNQCKKILLKDSCFYEYKKQLHILSVPAVKHPSLIIPSRLVRTSSVFSNVGRQVTFFAYITSNAYLFSIFKDASKKIKI